MVQSRSESYLKQWSFRAVVLTLRAILYHPKLHYSEKVLAAALLMEPRFNFPDDFKTGKLRRKLPVLLAKKFGVPLSSICLWIKRIAEVGDFKCLEWPEQGGPAIPYISIK